MIGVDVVDVHRMRSVLDRSPRLAEKLFTEAERAYCTRASDPVLHFAGTFAAKEAIVKALRLPSLLSWARRIEIVRDEDGVPAAHIEGRPDTVEISISHDGPVAVAVALRIIPR